ncbi:MAG: tetratricopeptide repeat protein [Deltaproteobacteria bacterium]|nr:tetratricopeptide repeat protein [Deltaproteobacteria bacterium]
MLPETSLSVCRKNIFACVVLLTLILIVYSNTFHASWHFDDVNNILKNRPLHLSGLGLTEIKKTFTAHWSGTGKLYRPVACLSFAVNYYLGGTEVAGYHWVNILIHILSSIFLYLFVYHTLNLPLLKGRYGSNSYFIALLSATLWAVNPVQTQSVTYIVQRMTSMAGMFSIMAIYFYLKGRISSGNPKKLIHYLACGGSGLLALGSKETALMLPMVILLYDLFLIQGVTKRSLKRYSLFFLMAVVVCLGFALVLEGPSILDPQWIAAGYWNKGFTLWQRLLTGPRIILFYISLLLYPMPDRLCLEHGITLSTGLFTPVSTLISILTLGLILSLAVAVAKKRPLISFCIIFFFMNHLVEASVFPLELIFEHRNYLPSMLFFVPIAILFSAGISYFAERRPLRWLITGFMVLLIVGWGNATFLRNGVWYSDETLWLDCAEKYPQLARPRHNLGVYYGNRGMPEKAVSEYLAALSRQNPNNLRFRNWTYFNLGAIHEKLGRDDKALFYYDQALKHQPAFPPTRVQRGIIFMSRGKYPEARSEFERALESDPEHASAHGNLGFLYLLTGQTRKAITAFTIAVSKDPGNPGVMRHLGLAFYLLGERQKAFIHFKKALARDNEDPFALLNLAILYSEGGMGQRAEDTMDRFFAAFRGNPVKLGRFINTLKRGPGTRDALGPWRKKALGLVAQACAERSREYGDLSGICGLKKGGQASGPVRLDDTP